MNLKKTALLFPGQSFTSPGGLKKLAKIYPNVVELTSSASQIFREFFGEPLPGFSDNDHAASALEFECAQVLIFLSDFAVFEALCTEGHKPDLLAGHGLGEIAALSAGGAIDFEAGVKLVCHRSAALKRHAIHGGMLSLACGSLRAREILKIIGFQSMAIAEENASGQTVVSGEKKALKAAAGVAHAIGIAAQQLDAAYPFHNPIMKPVADELRSVFGDVRAQPLHTRVYSPISLAEYGEGDQLGPILADQLIRPVRFTETVAQLYEDGFRVFVEAGGRRALCSLVQETLKSRSDFVALASNDPDKGEDASLAHVVEQIPKPKFKDSSSIPARIGFAGEFTQLSMPRLTTLLHALVEELASRGAMPIDQAMDDPKSASQPTHPEAEAPPLAADAEPADVTGHTAIEPSVPASPSDSGSGTCLYDVKSLEKQVVRVYQRVTEYPEDVFELDADLEADLGIDSIKQVHILSLLQKQFNLPEKADFAEKKLNTIARVIEMIAASSVAPHPAAVD